MKCEVEGCLREPRGHGRWCNAHRQRARRTGDPAHERWASAWDRFVDRVVVRIDSCWEWTGSGIGRHYEYGQFWFDNHNGSAHVYAYTTMVGPIPKGLQIDHLCRFPRCVNPAHLEAVTPLVNIRRKFAPPVKGLAL